MAQLRRNRSLIRGVFGAPLLVLVSCAIYSPQPLPDKSDLASSVTPRGVAPLDMNAVATLAVLNNPDLKASRALMRVAQAQAFAAGLLPDPQFSYSADHPTDHVISATDPRYPEYNAYGLGLTVDLQALLTHASRHAAASATYQQARLELLWQEWQTVAQARTLYVQQSIAAERLSFLTPVEHTYATAATRSQRALEEGNVTLEHTSADQAVLVDVRNQLGVTDRSALAAEQALRGLLGIDPQLSLPLQPLAPPEIPDRAAVQAATAQLTQRRPDLRALQAGYLSQEEKVRIAVLSQFPNVALGITHARDVSNVHTIGFGATLTLPLFDRGRGDIAIQRATREQLRAEYQARVDQAVSNTWQLWNEMQQLNAQLHQLDQQLPDLHTSVDRAQRAYESGNFSAASYLTLVSSYLAAQSYRSDLFQNLWTDSIALATVLGTQLQPSPKPSPKPR